MLLESIPAVLVDAFHEDRLVLFAGAGLSVASGLPTGKRLAFELQNELFRNEFTKTRPSPDDPLTLDTVAQRYRLAFGRQKLTEFLIRTFQRGGLRPNDAHRLAVQLFQRIFTTNFDTLLEDAVKELERSSIVVVRDLQLPNTSIPDRTIIYKLHGDINSPDRLVVTQRDYQRVPMTEGMENELKVLLPKNNLLFVGYGLGDPDFINVLEFCRSMVGEGMPKSYAVMPAVDSDRLFVKQCEEDNIDLFADTAADFLHDLQEAAQKVKVPAKGYVTPPLKVFSEPQEEKYRATVCEDFKWIDFKGIPVMGGHLRVPIDHLFVTMSALTGSDLQSDSKNAKRRLKATQRRVGTEGLDRSGKILKGGKIFKMIEDHRRVVILGDPGSGKTTLLRYVGYQLSLPQPQPDKVGLSEAYVPLFISLRQFSLFRKENSKGNLDSFLPDFLKTHSLSEYLGVIRTALEQGKCLLLLDGLDEVASQEERADIAGQVVQIATQYSSCRIIVTSRKVGYARNPVRNGFTHFNVEPFNDEDIRKFIDLWCEATKTPDKEKSNLVGALNNVRVRALATNPLLVTILARVYLAYHNLPERRAQLYAKCAEALLTTWDLVRDLPPVFEDAREANRIVGPLALWIHRDCKGQYVSKGQLLAKLEKIGNLPRDQEPLTLLTQMEERSGLIREIGFDQYAFTHLTFQEYYVARDVVSRGDCFTELNPFLRNDRWQEIVVLTAGLLDEQGQRPVTEFLNNFLVKPKFPTRPKAADAGKLGLLIASFTDRVEPFNYIAEYLKNSLLSLVNRKTFIGDLMYGNGWKLEGLSRTRLGASLIDELMTRLNQSSASVVRNCVILGYNLFREPLEKASYLVSALHQIDPRLNIATSAATQVARLMQMEVDVAGKDTIIRGARAMPIDRRLAFVTRMEELPSRRDNKEQREAVSLVWLTVEEMNALPRKPKTVVGHAEDQD